MMLRNRLLITTIPGFVIGLAVWVFTPLSFIAGIAIFGVLMLCVHLYISEYCSRVSKRRCKQWQYDIKPLEGMMWIPQYRFDQLCYNLLGNYTDKDGSIRNEDQVYLVTRRHKIVLYMRVAPVVILTAMLIALNVYILGIQLWWVNIVLVGVGYGASYYAAMEWLYTYIMITNCNYWIIKLPPAWVVFLDAEPDSVSLDQITIANSKNSILGNLLHYGLILMDTPAQDDAYINNQTYVPDHLRVLMIAKQAMMGARQRH